METTSASWPRSRLCVLLILIMSSVVGMVRSDMAKDKAECANTLTRMGSCLTYVQGDAMAPTPDCCDGLSDVYTKDRKCLCLAIKDLDEPEFGISFNASLALSLPSVCHNSAVNITECPTILNLPPGSKDAEIFLQYGKEEGNIVSPPKKEQGNNKTSVIKKPPDSNSTSHKTLVGSSWTSHKILIVGLAVAASVLALAMIFLIFLMIRRKKILNEEYGKVLHGVNVKPEIFSYAEMKAATEDFNPSNILGEGGYGLVFKGKLSDGRIVAVKELSATSSQGKHQFLTEIATISLVRHRNLVKLHGCCAEGDKRILVYEFLENKSLDQALFGENKLHLDWTKRFDICLGVAKGLAYLHEESSMRIVHRDIKASNILLDAELNPKISDFGLAKLYDDNNTHVSTKIAGTIGYLAPEYAMKGHLTKKTDVYAFGVLSLEILAGRPNSDERLDTEKIFLLEWAWYLHENKRELELVDGSLSSFNKDEVDRVISVALVCTQASPTQRPPMSRVVAMLSGDIKVTKVTMKPSYLADCQSYKDGDIDYTSTSTKALEESQGTK